MSEVAVTPPKLDRDVSAPAETFVRSVAVMTDIAMIFEFWFDPDRPERVDEYLRESAAVRPQVEGLEGFLGVERFRSTADPHRFVAVGAFSDEDAVARWRTHPAHRRVQRLGRERLFAGYRLRMADVKRDYGKG